MKIVFFMTKSPCQFDNIQEFRKNLKRHTDILKLSDKNGIVKTCDILPVQQV